MPRLCSALVTGVLLVGAGAGQSIERLDRSNVTSEEIDATVRRLMAAGNVTGVGIAVLNSRKIAYVKAYGERDTENHLPLTPESVMTAASYSKAMFACAVMQLVDEGALNLDRPIQQYLQKPLPSYPRYSELAGDARYKQITARMLLSHTAGFRTCG